MRIFQPIISGSLTQSGSAVISGSLNVLSGITGSVFGTASWSVSSSYTSTASYVNTLNQTVTISGSLNHLGDYNHNGTVYHSGSKFLNGVFVQTGSLLISGSTTQIGTNNLFGNTILSGTIIISGALTSPPTPTIKVYGDMETNGVIKFMPVVKSIDTSISASYIYVSGSTNDLYFSQNGSGYANTTRLRWLEGNLYTGLFNGGLITTASSTTFNISSGSGIIVNLNASLGNNPYPTIQYVNWGNLNNQTLLYRTSSIQTFVGIDSNGQIIQQIVPWTDGQYNTSISIGTVIHQNLSTINASITYPNVAYGYKQRTYDFIKAFGPLKLSGFVINTSSSLGLTVGSGTAFADGRNYQVDPNNPSYITDPGTTVSKIFRYYQSGSGFVQDTNGGLGYTVLDPANYNNNGTLTSISPSTPYTIQRIFWYPNSATKGIVAYYGNAQYASIADAAANLSFETFSETENTKQNAVYLGAVIIKYNGVFTNPVDFSILPAGIFRNVGGGGGGGTVTTTLSTLGDVTIAGPTNGQPLVYNTSLAKWQNSSSVTASLNGNATTATTASYALTASYVNGTVNVTTATIGNTTYATVSTSAGAGTTTIYSVPNSTYSSIFVDYSINEGTTNARAGTIQVISVGTEINYTETATMDIGNTDDISWSIYLSGSDINFDIVNAAAASWAIKFSSRQL